MAKRNGVALLVALLVTVKGIHTAGAQIECADPIEPAGISASDALVMLRSAVGLEQCSLCACDPDGSGLIAATDSLLALKAAVGQTVTLACPFCCGHCDCSPRTVSLTLSDVAPCTDCIPRVPTSFSLPDSVSLTFAEDINGTRELVQVEPCVWQTLLTGAIAEKIGFNPGVTDCTGGPAFQFSGIDVALRAVRTESGWEVYVGQYPISFGWGDMVRATIESPACDIGGNASSENQICTLKGVDDAEGYDTQATGGAAELLPTDPQPVCP